MNFRVKRQSKDSKWNCNFVQAHFDTIKSLKLQTNSMNVKQFTFLKKFALVRITALVEKYSQSSPKSSWDRFRY